MTIVLPRDPDGILLAVMLHRLEDAEIWDDAEGLSLSSPVDLSAFDLTAVARRYKAAFGDFHKSWYEKRMKDLFRRHLFWVSRHFAPDRVALITRTVTGSFTRGVDAVLQKAGADDARFLSYSNQSMREWHRLTGLVRLSRPRGDLLYGMVETDFHIIDAVLIFLKRRYPQYNIAIRNRGQVAFSGEPERIDTVAVENADSEISRLFEVYYDSQFIKERKNIRLLTHFVPKKYWGWISDGRKMAKHAG